MSTIATAQVERFHFISARDGLVKARAFVLENMIATYRKSVLQILVTGRYAMYRRQLIAGYCAAKQLIRDFGELSQAYRQLRETHPESAARVAKYVPMLERNIALHFSIIDGYRYVSWPAPNTLGDETMGDIVGLFQRAGWEATPDVPMRVTMRRPEPDS